MTVRILDEAQDQLTRIIDHIALDDPSAARRVREILEEGILALDLFPQMWPATSNPQIRKRAFPGLAFQVFYLIEGQHDVLVLRVWDGRRGEEPFGRL